MSTDPDNRELQLAGDLLRHTNESFFLTGRAGTGKSSFLRRMLEENRKRMVVVAPTGIAAVNVGGMTIHSFFQFPLRPILPEDEGIELFHKNAPKRRVIATMDTLVIDEISMVRADIMDAIDYSLRKNGGDPDLPFGGKQVICIGDLFQLEPVASSHTNERDILSEIYGSPYFFRAKVFDRISLLTLELKKVYRQADPDFIGILDRVRMNTVRSTDLEFINSRYNPDPESDQKDFAITLTPTNAGAERVNHHYLERLDTPLYRFAADIKGEFEKNKYPTDAELVLREGAQVIFIRNDLQGRWVNGTIGQVSKLADGMICVKLNNGQSYELEKREWENIRYRFDFPKHKIEQQVIGNFTQYPLKLAWAITIHKSQGLTFDRVILDFGRGAFAGGQAYVALSRVTGPEGLVMKSPITSRDIFTDPLIRDFAATFSAPDLLKDRLENGSKIYAFQKNKDFENLGAWYFLRGIEQLLQGNTRSSYDSLLAGLDQASCDCALAALVVTQQEKIGEKLEQVSNQEPETHFLQAVAGLFLDQPEEALHHISEYLLVRPRSEAGYYLKGRICALLGHGDEVLAAYTQALSIRDTPRVQYRLGRYLETTLGEKGAGHLHKALLGNLSSLCVHRWLKNIAEIRGITLQKRSERPLVRQFNEAEMAEYLQMVRSLLAKGRLELPGGETVFASVAFRDLGYALKQAAPQFNNAHGVIEFPLGEDCPDLDEIA